LTDRAASRPLSGLSQRRIGGCSGSRRELCGQGQFHCAFAGPSL